MTTTNARLGELLGLSDSGASRLRNGDRRPSPEVMARIERVLGWSAVDQFVLCNQKNGLSLFAEGLAEAIADYERQHAEAAITPA